MITTESIESYVENHGSTTREVFSSLVESDSKATQELVRSSEKTIKKYLVRQGINVDPTPNWLKSVCLELEIEDLMLILESADVKERKSWSATLFEPFRALILKMIGYVLDLDFSASTHEQQLQSGDAIMLACLYLHISDANLNKGS